MQGEKRPFRALLPIFLLLTPLLTGCGVNTVAISSNPWDTLLDSGAHHNITLNIGIIPYRDTRKGITNTREIAVLHVPVYGIRGNKIYADRDISSIVTDGMKESLVLLGARLKTLPGYMLKENGSIDVFNQDIPHDIDIILTGEVKGFHLDVGTKDRIYIEIKTTLIERKTGRVIWGGSIAESGERFAGTFGNTKEGIERYINIALTSVIKKTLKQARPSIDTYLKKISQSDKYLSSGHTQGSRLPEKGKTNPSTANGSLKVTSIPTGAKFYIGDVYYGKTPLVVELKPDIYEVTIRLRGYKDVKEKVAIRSGIATELDVYLEKNR